MLGARIAALRRQAGISQAVLAQFLHVSASTIGMYEQGRREPAADCIVRIAQFFHVSTDYLLTGIPRTEEDEISAALYQNLRQLLPDRYFKAAQQRGNSHFQARISGSFRRSDGSAFRVDVPEFPLRRSLTANCFCFTKGEIFFDLFLFLRYDTCRKHQEAKYG